MSDRPKLVAPNPVAPLVSTKEACLQLKIGYDVFITRSQTRGFHPVSRARNRYLWHPDQIALIGLTNAEYEGCLSKFLGRVVSEELEQFSVVSHTVRLDPTPTNNVPYGQSKHMRSYRATIEPVAPEAPPKTIVTYDVETRMRDSDDPGFERPVMVAFTDSTGVTHLFQNDPRTQTLPWPIRHVVPGLGCIDRMLEAILGGFPGATPEDVARHQAPEVHIAARNGHGAFAPLFILGWLARHTDRYDLEIRTRQSHITKIKIWPKGKSPKDGHWIFRVAKIAQPAGSVAR